MSGREEPGVAPRADGDGRTHRIVVVSPHLDDGALSLGAAIAWWARMGARVELLTVFGCDPESTAEAGGWDVRGGFRTEGEAARARREEDRRACSILGAHPVWLPFGDVDYDRHGDEAGVREAVARAADGADELLLPGSPLIHPDHDWLAHALAGGRYGCRRLGLYAEQPYRRRAGGGVRPPRWVEETLGTELTFGAVPVGLRDRIAKSRAIRCYRSQLPMLALRGRALYQMLWSEARAGGEAVAWLPAATGSTV